MHALSSMEGWLFWAVAITASVCVGLAKGGWSIMGVLSVPILTLIISPIAAAGLLLPVFIVSDLFGLWVYRKEFNKELLILLAPAATLGVVVGYFTSSMLNERFITAFIGLIGLVFVMRFLIVKFSKNSEEKAQPIKIAPGIFFGFLSGLTSFISHSGATPYQIYVLPLKLKKIVFASTTTVFFAYVNMAKLPGYYLLGSLEFKDLKIVLLLMIPAILAVFVGAKLVKIIPEKIFFNIIIYALLLVSIRLLVEGIFGI